MPEQSYSYVETPLAAQLQTPQNQKTVPRILAHGAQANSASFLKIYTVPQKTFCRLTEAIFFNRSGAAVDIAIALVPPGGSAPAAINADDVLLNSLAVAAVQPLSLVDPFTALEASWMIYLYTTVGGGNFVNYHLSGELITTA